MIGLSCVLLKPVLKEKRRRHVLIFVSWIKRSKSKMQKKDAQMQYSPKISLCKLSNIVKSMVFEFEIFCSFGRN